MLKHTTPATLANDPLFEINTNAWNQDHTVDKDGITMAGDTTDTAAPTSGNLKLYAKNTAGRMMPKWVGPSGLDMTVMPHLALNKIAFWNPPGNATTVPAVFGMAAYTSVGTATARNVATTNMFTRMKRLGYVSASTAGSLASIRVAAAQYTIGADGTPALGGFFKVFRFGVSATIASARMFVGMASSTAAPANVEPSTLTNVIGIGKDAADTNLRVFFGGSSAQTSIDLGANFPATTVNTDVYELVLFAPPNTLNTVNYRVTRLNTNNVASGTLTAATAGVQLPAATTLLTMTWGFITNNATASAVAIDIISDYIETDY